MADTDLTYKPATELARLIREKTLSPVELMAATLRRIEAVNPVLNCFCFTYPEEALDAARAAEAAVMADAPLGPLHGLPIAIKDLTPTKGKRTTLGSRVYEHWVPGHDAAIVESFAAAGGILVGKTTTPEFAYSGFCHSPLWGVTRNPWDPTRTPGGSSGGSGVAVATGCVAVAEGTDMLGSVRVPAAFCGIVGLKPSLGRIPMDILPSGFDTISHFGPMARTVGDAALMLGAVQGPDERDILSLAPALDVSVPLAGDVRGKRLALSIDLGFFAIHPEVEANTRAAADALRDAGAEVEEVDLRWTRELVDAGWAMWGVFMAAYFGHHLDEWRGSMDPSVVAQMEEGFAMSAVDYKRIEFVRTKLWRDMAALFETYDALLCPTASVPALEAEGRDGDHFGEDAAGRLENPELTGVFNLVAPCPALSVPSGFAGDGLPTGLQIVGRRHDDLGLLDIGAAFEKAMPWNGARPPI